MNEITWNCSLKLLIHFHGTSGGGDIGEKYTNQTYTENLSIFTVLKNLFRKLNDADSVVVEVRPLVNYLEVVMIIRTDYKNI